MRFKEFGKTGKKISALGLGGMRFDPENENLAVQTIHRAVELGINYIDTAPDYCQDRSESFVGTALAALPPDLQKSVFVSTKSHHRADPTADAVLKRIEGQLRRLQRERIDFYQMWCLMDLDQFRLIMQPGGPYAGALKAREQGLITHLCCSVHASGEDIAAMVREDVFEGFTLGYNILNHTYRKPGLEAAARAGLGVVTMNPLGGGMLTQDKDRLSVLRDDDADSVIAAALRFNLAHAGITVVLSGMKNPGEVEANVQALDRVKRPDPAVVDRLLHRFDSLGESFCTGCSYCLKYCPEGIQIPLLAGLWDRVRMKLPEEARRMFAFFCTDEERWLKGKRASDCTQCGECEAACTQKIPIREYMQNLAEFFSE